MMLKKATARSIFWLFALAAAAVAMALLVGRNHAMVTVFWAPYRLDLSFNLLLFLTIAVFVLLHLALRGLATLRALPEKASRWRAVQIERSIANDLLDALAQLTAGRFVRAQASAQRAAGALQANPGLVLPQRGQQTVLAYGLWAEAAHALQDRSQRDFYLKLALDERWSSSAPEAQDGVVLQAIQWALEDTDAVAARAWWRQLPSRANRRIQALRLKLRLSRMDGNREEALETARLLSKHRAFSATATASLVKALVLDSLRQTNDLDGLKRVWARLSDADRTHPDVALAVATQAATWLSSGPDTQQQSLAHQVAAWLLPVWGRWAQLDDVQRQRLVLVLEQAMPHLGAEWLARVEQTQQQWPQHATLHYLAGQACMQRRLWGKAHQLLSQASQSLKDPAMLRRAWCSLAQLAQERGDEAAEEAAWKTAAQIA
ncbi:MAG: heme biosynthesis protein HemY [Hydrogenophaga sp.]|jgi:HemY protein|nr:heme biosynthesis protein HemY [Hydrogenophaga sp.]